jgi:hypothetical protein
MQEQCKGQSSELATSFEIRVPTQRLVVGSAWRSDRSGPSLRGHSPVHGTAGLPSERLHPWRPRQWRLTGGCCGAPCLTAAHGKP